MKKTVLFTGLLIGIGLQKLSAQTANNQYDSVLAKKLHADPYGMKKYILVMLKRGTAKVTDNKKRDSVFRGHMANINRLANEGKLILAGPFGENSQYEGLFLFNTDNMDDAKSWVSSDPAIKAKFFTTELFHWYGSAAIQEVLNIHPKIEKTRF